MEKIIAISGKAESGKDTFAELIVKNINNIDKRYEILRINFADQLKHDLSKYFDIPTNKGSVSYRDMMQFVGTDVVRKRQPNFWVNNVVNKIYLYDSMFDIALISDARFINEMDLLQECADQHGYDFISMRIQRAKHSNRLTDEQRQHSSETNLDDYDFDYFINNNRDIITLNNTAKCICEEIFS